MSRIHIRKGILEVDRLKLHCLVELSLNVLAVLEILLDVRVDLVELLLLILVIRLVGRVSLPAALLLVTKVVLVVDLLVLAFNANAKLSTFLPFFEAKAILLLAMWLFTSTENEIFHAGLICIHLFEVVHILAIFLLNKVQYLIFFLFSFLIFLIPLQLKSPRFLQILIFEGDASGAALPNNTYFSWT